jgi:hypothetical protein
MTKKDIDEFFLQTVTEDDVVRNTGNEKRLKRGNLGWIRGVMVCIFG